MREHQVVIARRQAPDRERPAAFHGANALPDAAGGQYRHPVGSPLVRARSSLTPQAREAPGAMPAVTAETQSAIDGMHGGGAPLDAATRSFMEPRFGHDFSQVRVHTDQRAATAARSINALAFTVGSDIAFAPGQYQPGSDGGRQLLAHELTHTIQQTGGVQHVGAMSASGMLARQEAPATETAVAAGPSNALADAEELVATASLPPRSDTFWRVWGAQFEQIRRMFEEQRYGCFCGPGAVCNDPIDNLDRCCQEHDRAYGDVGVNMPGGVSMWSIEGFKRTVVADTQLVLCAQATALDLNFYGPAAATFRAGVAIVFGTRAAIGAWLIANGY